MSYVFHPAAMQELDQAVDYYNEHGGKGGNKNADNHPQTGKYQRCAK